MERNYYLNITYLLRAEERGYLQGLHQGISWGLP